jgi:hypothetical protein
VENQGKHGKVPAYARLATSEYAPGELVVCSIVGTDYAQGIARAGILAERVARKVGTGIHEELS